MNPPHGLFPPFVGYLTALALVVGAVFLVRYLRGAALRSAWSAVATALEGELSTPGGDGLLSVKGRYRGRPAFLKQAVSHEDAIPYPHTRGSFNIRNPGSAVMGLRRKSMLEEVLTRKDARPVETGDADFDRRFFLLLTLPEHAGRILPADTRRTLGRYPDVEIYLRSTQIEWRRSGLVRSSKDILRLMDMLADIADAVESLPTRELSLTDKLAEEELIQKGV